jgi:hypothetical protein
VTTEFIEVTRQTQAPGAQGGQPFILATHTIYSIAPKDNGVEIVLAGGGGKLQVVEQYGELKKRLGVKP